jgi:hypothetical protein
MKLRIPTHEEAQEVIALAKDWNKKPRIRERFNSVSCTLIVAEYIANQRGFTLWKDDLERHDS